MTKQESPLVTIGLCTYNRADTYLRDALQSAVDQNYPNLEIVISDNCSTDNTEELVESFADPRIRYFKQERNLGVTNNFNFCLEQAQGAYFLLLHDDDMIDPDFIDTCLGAADYRTDFGLIRTGLRRIDENGAIIKEQPNLASGLSTEEFFRAWFSGGTTPMHVCCTLFNTQWLREVGGFQSEKDLFCDVVPEVLLAARHKRLDVQDVKASYRIHPTKHSVTGRVEDWCVDSRYLLDIMLALVGNSNGSLRKRGLRFFTRHCFEYARSVRSLRDRITAYRIVHRSFEYSTPFFLKEFFTKPLSSFLKRGVRKIRSAVS